MSMETPPGLSSPPGLTSYRDKKSEDEEPTRPPAPGIVGSKEGEDDEDTPPGFPSKPKNEAAEKLSADVAKIEVTGDQEQPDEPDLALRVYEGLKESDQEIRTSTVDNTIYQSAKTFEELNLSPELLKGIYTEMRFERPSKIQASTLPMVLTPPYNDIIAQAQNGSGKTTCFVLAMLSRVDPALKEPQALCVCPTRELVLQNTKVCELMAKYTSISITSTAAEVDEGLGMTSRRNEKIRDQVVFGAHGRIKAWLSKRLMPDSNFRILVFDEADEMLKADAFADDSVRLIRQIRKNSPRVQILLFSATFNETVKSFAMKICPRANHVFVPKEELSLDVIAQYNVTVPVREEKNKVLREMIFPNCERLGQTIIFVKTREAARLLHNMMNHEGYKCTSIQGDMLPADRDKVVTEFREGRTKILISTDVLSRGFDVSQVTLVINYDIPVERNNQTPNYETYLHRIGRSGRFGRKGAAFNLICGDQEARMMHDIARYFNRKIPEVPYDNEEHFLKVLAEAGLS